MSDGALNLKLIRLSQFAIEVRSFGGAVERTAPVVLRWAQAAAVTSVRSDGAISSLAATTRLRPWRFAS